MPLNNKTAFLGMGFGKSSVPIDAVCILLAGLEVEKYTLLLTDEFYRFNGLPEEDIQDGLDHTVAALERLAGIYGFRPDIVKVSEFVYSQEYKVTLRRVEEQVKEKRFVEKLLETVPLRYRTLPEPLKYTLNEIACVDFLCNKFGMQLKLGPRKEEPYDFIIKELGVPINFGYLIDAYAIGSRHPEKVVHYVPADRGRTNGQRIFLEESLHKAGSKILMASREASGYLLTLASAAGYRLGRGYFKKEEIDAMGCRQAKKAARGLVLDNIMRPYHEASRI